MEDFTASNGWIQKFMRLHGLSLRRKTIARKDPEQLVDKLVAYVLQARILLKCFGYQPCNIIALMDETAVWADMTSETTVESKGARTVCLKTTGHEKITVSVCLAAKLSRWK